ncbi:flagellar basal-body rod protein FlgF [Profundibacterium mesophilum]|uniref:Flagellar basal-body rod protein FlgF n=1 Tax=Profundibacterium mesophilum KAUST100406-0324 TaxID=1037889 RepID=A0A921NN90_9RHOB|nr:flagellar basal-body rod protein FlgF [Profundibacterium mesophilum]KAF0674646.1 Flagellar basal body rod protein [Profundibacterium mesophilum KAUST100406-0324]
MDNSTHVSLSSATAMMRQLDVTANNIANANTSGFKSERVVFESFVHRDTGREGEETSFVIDTGSYLDAAQGQLQQTGNPLDVALSGTGWMSYETAEGQRAYGRDGQLMLDLQGNLVTSTGAQVLDAGGGPIALPPDIGAQVTIARDGTIAADGIGVIAQIGLFDLGDLQSFTRIGGGMFIPPQGAAQDAIPATGTAVVQGAVEGSNVQPVVELSRMMAIEKAYERSVKLMGGEDDLRRDALRRLGQAV